MPTPVSNSPLEAIRNYFTWLGSVDNYKGGDKNLKGKNPFKELDKWVSQSGDVGTAARYIRDTFISAGLKGKIDTKEERSYFSNDNNITAIIDVLEGRVAACHLDKPLEPKSATSTQTTLTIDEARSSIIYIINEMNGAGIITKLEGWKNDPTVKQDVKEFITYVQNILSEEVFIAGEVDTTGELAEFGPVKKRIITDRINDYGIPASRPRTTTVPTSTNLPRLLTSEEASDLEAALIAGTDKSVYTAGKPYSLVIDAAFNGYQIALDNKLSGADAVRYAFAYASSAVSGQYLQQFTGISSDTKTKLEGFIDAKGTVTNQAGIDALKQSNPQEAIAIGYIVDQAQITHDRDAAIQAYTPLGMAQGNVYYLIRAFLLNPTRTVNHADSDKALLDAQVALVASHLDSIGQVDLQRFYQTEYARQKLLAAQFREFRVGLTPKLKLAIPGHELIDTMGALTSFAGLPDVLTSPGELFRPRMIVSPFTDINAVPDPMLRHLDVANGITGIIRNLPRLQWLGATHINLNELLDEGNIELIFPLLSDALHTSGIRHNRREYARFAGQFEPSLIGKGVRALNYASMFVADESLLEGLIEQRAVFDAAKGHMNGYQAAFTLDDYEVAMGLDPTKEQIDICANSAHPKDRCDIYMDEAKAWMEEQNAGNVSSNGAFVVFDLEFPVRAQIAALEEAMSTGSQNLTTDLIREFGPGIGITIGALTAAGAPVIMSFIPGKGWAINVSDKARAYDEAIAHSTTETIERQTRVDTILEGAGARLSGVAFAIIAVDWDKGGRTDPFIHYRLAKQTGILSEYARTLTQAGLISAKEGSSVVYIPLIIDAAANDLQQLQTGVMDRMLFDKVLAKGNASTPWDKAQVAIIYGLKLAELAEGWIAAGKAAHDNPDDATSIYVNEAAETLAYGLGWALPTILPKNIPIFGDHVVFNPDVSPGSVFGGNFRLGTKEISWGLDVNPVLQADPLNGNNFGASSQLTFRWGKNK
ncbi:hypothetical protein K1X76_02465 [bacterium]|nr:hypothetical protein [bacterium]